MNKFFIALVGLLTVLVVGCNQLTQYSVTEQEINQALAKRNNYAKDLGLPGLADAHIVLSNLTSQIGRQEPNKVTLNGDANVNLTSIFGNQQATLKLTLKALPTFNKEQGAIYLQDMEGVNVEVLPQKMESVMKTITPYLNQSLKAYFNQQPAYVLSEDRSKGEALAKQYAKGIEVKPGEIVIPFVE
ncbi:lipoprotein [Atlantibacter sp.]|uniref:lipoprotein n=1 Tax=Atlantibacter sp. TaxID=1903473 RepID=UPI0028966CDF|nr:lipoprotein [Atlantibacter sp.]